MENTTKKCMKFPLLPPISQKNKKQQNMLVRQREKQREREGEEKQINLEKNENRAKRRSKEMGNTIQEREEKESYYHCLNYLIWNELSDDPIAEV